MSAVAIIPARANSRRIPHKNRKLFHGRPVIQYSIDAAKQSGLFERIYVSTDDSVIMEIISGQDVLLHLRSTAYLCEDECGTQEVARDWLLNSTTASFDYACVIYPVAPMMTAEDLLRAERWMDFSEGRGYAHIPGWFYYARTDTFLQAEPVENSLPMTAPAERYIDVNTPADWLEAEKMYAALHPEIA